MRLNDFVKKDDIKKQSAYKVVVGNSPKEQELAKEASKVTSLQNSVDESNAKLSDIRKENEFLKEQVKINQHEKDEFKTKVNALEDVKIQLIEKENRLTDVLEETHELAIKENSSKELVKDLKIQLNDKTGEFDTLQNKYINIENELASVIANYNGILSDLERQKDFSEKTQDEYNKIRDRNTVLMQERENLSRLKAEFEVKSIRLGDELNKAQEVKKILEDKLVKITDVKINTEKDAIKSSNLSNKLEKDLTKLHSIKKTLESALVNSKEDVKDLSQITQVYKEQLSKKKHEATEWNIAKQQLKLGNAYTYPNKLGFEASPFFKLDKEK
tara:strand:+ start:2721 stop:3710 length:990 start_codon:yes stop_codon:yes gene_type:complete